MSIVYDVIFLVVAIIYLPIYLFKKKFHSGFLLRLGILPKDLELNRPVWIHAVSVGEVMAVGGLLEELRMVYSGKRFLISTITPTGNKIAKGMAKDTDFVTYLPLDLSFIVRSVIDRVKPSIFIIAETELWPNLISYLYIKNIPIVVVNGRISDRSFKGYLSIKYLIKPILNKINLFCVQTSRDAQRLMSLGVFKDKIQITGNMKFDIKVDFSRQSFNIGRVPAEAGEKNYTDYKLKLGLEYKEKLFVAGSTHPGEEEIILSAYKELLSEFPDLRLLIAPRHPERSEEIANLIKKFGFESKRISLLDSRTHELTNSRTVFILDTVGQLLSFYAISDIVFVGGSLVKKGGHNILEPASLGKPILFGPHMFNFRDIADLFLSNRAAILVRHQEDLKTNVKYLLNNTSKVTELSRRAKELIIQNQGATNRHIELIRNVEAKG